MQNGATVARGLEGVVSHATTLSEVDGERGRLVIRGYDVHDLVGRVSFEEAAYLLWYGVLPTASQIRDLRREMAVARHIPGAIVDMLRGPARAAVGMHALRIAAAMLSVDDADVDDCSSEASRRRAVRITARIPALIAHHYRLNRGEPIVEPTDHLGFAAGYLYMLEDREPEAARVAALDAYMVAVIDHGMNASSAATLAASGSRSSNM